MGLLSMTRLIKIWPIFAIIGVADFSYFKGYSNGKTQAQLVYLQEKKEAVARAIQQAEEIAKVNQQIANAFHSKQEKAKVKIKIIEKEVIQYVEKHRNDDGCNLDADGVRLINDLINTANG